MRSRAGEAHVIPDSRSSHSSSSHCRSDKTAKMRSFSGHRLHSENCTAAAVPGRFDAPGRRCRHAIRSTGAGVSMQAHVDKRCSWGHTFGVTMACLRCKAKKRATYIINCRHFEPTSQRGDNCEQSINVTRSWWRGMLTARHTTAPAGSDKPSTDSVSHPAWVLHGVNERRSATHCNVALQYMHSHCPHHTTGTP